jgi:hypothetical protein
MLSAAILATGAVGAALHYALVALLGGGRSSAAAPMSSRLRTDLERDKALVLRSIKELEFDHAMRKVSDADFAEISGRLRARAMALIAQLEAAPAAAARPAAPAGPVARNRECPACHSQNESGARFCSQCGARLA